MGRRKGGIPEIKQRIGQMDLVCSGTLYSRKKPCGKPNCRCASGSPEDLHGPYWEWNRRVDGRLVHRIVSESQAEELARALANRREIETLLKDWERITAETVLGPGKRKP